MGNLDWLVSEDVVKEATATELNIGSDFARGTMTTEWLWRPRWGFQFAIVTEDELTEAELKYDFLWEIGGNYRHIFCKTGEEAILALGLNDKKREEHAIDRQNPVAFFLTMTANIPSIIGWRREEPPEEVYRNGVMYDVQMRTWMSKLNLHGPLLFTMPSIVQEIAVNSGMMQRRVFDYADLARIPDHKAMVAQSEELIGAKRVWDDPEWKWQSLPGYMDRQDSLLFQARKKIWAALGADTTINGYWKARLHTDPGVPKDSPLEQILAVLMNKDITVIGSIARVHDPMDYRDPEDPENEERLKYGTIPIFTRVYKSLEDAKKDVGGDLEKKADIAPSDYPELPGDWAALSVDDFLENAREIAGELDMDSLGNKVKSATLAKRLEITTAQLKKWESFIFS